MSAQSQLFDTCVAQIGVVKSYAHKSEIIEEEDAADHIYEVISGAVCTYRMLKEGRRQIAGFYFPGDIFGLEAAEKHILAAEAVTNSKVLVAKKQALNALISRDAEIADRLLSLTARELARKQAQVLLLSRNAEERVIYFLIEMSQRISPQDYLIALPMTRRHVADYLGLTIETVSRILWNLERRGAIKIGRRKHIALRNQYTNGRSEMLVDLFEGVRPSPEVTAGVEQLARFDRRESCHSIQSHVVFRWRDRGAVLSMHVPRRPHIFNPHKCLSRKAGDVRFWHKADIEASSGPVHP